MNLEGALCRYLLGQNRQGVMTVRQDYLDFEWDLGIRIPAEVPFRVCLGRGGLSQDHNLCANYRAPVGEDDSTFQRQDRSPKEKGEAAPGDPHQEEGTITQSPNF